jgi:hypothetical protein
MGRMQELYEKKGYPKEWIDKRLRGIAVRQDLTDELILTMLDEATPPRCTATVTPLAWHRSRRMPKTAAQ